MKQSYGKSEFPLDLFILGILRFELVDFDDAWCQFETFCVGFNFISRLQNFVNVDNEWWWNSTKAFL